MTVSHLYPAIALRMVYQKLLKGGTERYAFDEATRFLDLDVGTIEAWELAYRTKGHIVVGAAFFSCAMQFSLKLTCQRAPSFNHPFDVSVRPARQGAQLLHIE